MSLRFLRQTPFARQVGFLKQAVFVLLAVFMVASLVAGVFQPASAVRAENAKYIFLFVGDGMGVAHRSAAELYLATQNGTATGEWQNTKLLMNTFPAQGITTTYDAGSMITDSASAGTAFATGHKTLSGMINMSPDKKEKYTTIAEIAKKSGWKIGIVSSVSLDHATPACFFAHTASRKNMYEIEEQLVKSGFDYFAGGGFAQPTGAKQNQADNLVFAQKAGYTITTDRAGFAGLQPGKKAIAFNPTLDSEKAMPYAIDMPEGDITLAEFTAKGIELLDNPTGFFMMVEGGKIDWAAHANDPMATIGDMLAFDAAIAEAYAFYEQHPDETLIIVTGDHETGGLAIGSAGTQYASYFDRLSAQKVSYVGFGEQLEALKAEKPAARLEDVLPMITENYGLTVLTDAERKTLDEAVKAGAAKDATDEARAAAKEAKAALGMALSAADLEALNAAFAETMKPADKRATGDAAYLAYGGYDPLTMTISHILSSKAGLGWSSYSHTATPVQTSAVGAGAGLFEGYYDNTEIFFKMMEIAGFAQ